MSLKYLLVIFLTALSFTLYAQPPGLKYGEISNPKRAANYYAWYKASNGQTFKLFQKIKLGFPEYNKTFTYIQQGDGILIAPAMAPASLAGQEFEIKKIFVLGSEKSGWVVYATAKGRISLMNLTIQIENALATGEIVTNILTSDQALEKLKKEKDKLDLGITTQEQYDSVKAILAPLVK